MIANWSPVKRFAAAAAVFVILELVLMLFVDKPLSQYLRGVDTRDKGLIDIFRAYTDYGKSFWYLWPSGIGFIICLGLSFYRGLAKAARKKFGLAAQKFGFFFACVALSGIVTDILKPIIGRARPILLERENFYGFTPFDTHFNRNSFPSGHTTTGFAVACALIVLWPRGKWLFIAFALAIAASRVMVNAHFLSDTVAGAAVGFLTVLCLRDRFYRRNIG